MTNLKREIEFPNDYDKKKVDSRTQIRSNAIRDYKAARYGGDIREAMADGVDISSVIATEANDNSKSAKLIANGTQNRLDAQIKDAVTGYIYLLTVSDGEIKLEGSQMNG